MALTTREMEMAQDTNVVAYIERRQAAIAEECRAEGATFFMVPTTKWAEQGCYANVYEYVWSMTLNDYSDTHKELYGFRPRGDFSHFTLVEIETLLEELWAQMPESHEDDYQVLETWVGEDVQLEGNWEKYERMAEALGY